MKMNETMITAQRIMKKKGFIKAEMDRQLTEKQSNFLWKKATRRLAAILNQYASLPKGIRSHTDNFIFPSVAIYLTAKEHIPAEKAFSIIEDAAVTRTTDIGKMLARLMRLPGMGTLFISIWDPMTKKKFGPDSGFRNRFYPKKRGEYRMDILACPYNKYFSELGCPELTKIFCGNDDRCYGNLPGLEFKRSGTLGTGADLCDFYLRKV
jgi:hypothetical protein